MRRQLVLDRIAHERENSKGNGAYAMGLPEQSRGAMRCFSTFATDERISDMATKKETAEKSKAEKEPSGVTKAEREASQKATRDFNKSQAEARGEKYGDEDSE